MNRWEKIWTIQEQVLIVVEASIKRHWGELRA
jgi:hypothetical protein